MFERRASYPGQEGSLALVCRHPTWPRLPGRPPSATPRRVDYVRRNKIMPNHTFTHVLNYALRKVRRASCQRQRAVGQLVNRRPPPPPALLLLTLVGAAVQPRLGPRLHCLPACRRCWATTWTRRAPSCCPTACASTSPTTVGGARRVRLLRGHASGATVMCGHSWTACARSSTAGSSWCDLQKIKFPHMQAWSTPPSWPRLRPSARSSWPTRSRVRASPAHVPTFCPADLWVAVNPCRGLACPRVAQPCCSWEPARNAGWLAAPLRNSCS